jgi:L-ribulokinase
MTRLGPRRYRPDPRRRRTYQRLYAQYRVLHDGFGGVARDRALARVMKELLSIKSAAAKP